MIVRPTPYDLLTAAGSSARLLDNLFRKHITMSLLAGLGEADPPSLANAAAKPGEIAIAAAAPATWDERRGARAPLHYGGHTS